MIKDVWDRLSECGKPVVVYGMGNGADKIADRLSTLGVEIVDFFASDGFVRGQSFRGKRVLTFGQILERYSDFVILVAFATRLREVLDAIYSLDEKYEVYAPDVPVVGNEIFDADFYDFHRSQFDRVREILADEESVKIFNNILEYKLTGRIGYLRESVSSKAEVLLSVLHPSNYRTVCDIGAYDGDTVREFMNDFEGVRRVISLEPDLRNYRKLMSFLEKNGIDCVEAYNCGAWSEDSYMTFSASGNRNSRVDSLGKKEVSMRSLDGILGGRRVDYIKYDVEGSEYEALQGSRKTIEKYAPDLCVSIYHRSEDIFKLPFYIHKLNPEYKLYIRRFEYIPAWDLNLYACM